MAKQLHYRSMRYEVQEYRKHTISWKPIAHAPTADIALQLMQNAADKKRNPVYRVLDRIRGASRATVLAEIGEAIELKGKN